jgi:hypothetical protein
MLFTSIFFQFNAVIGGNAPLGFKEASEAEDTFDGANTMSIAIEVPNTMLGTTTAKNALGLEVLSGKTERFEVDFGVCYQLNDWLFFNRDLTLTKVRSIEKASGQDYIPIAPDLTIGEG